MAVQLENLLCNISNAVCNANKIMETIALEQYMEQGYQESPFTAANGISPLEPITLDLALNGNTDSNDIQRIPITALMHNTTMRLEQVDLKLKFKMFEQDGKIMVDCMPHHSTDASLDEMNLQFKNSASAEGISRITDAHMKQI